jgi:TatD DNase family protein
MTLVDTHCHIDLPAFDADREDVLTRCYSAGISHIVVPGVTAQRWDILIQTCRLLSGAPHPALHPCFGLHPVFIAQHCESDLDILVQKIEQQQPIAVGEIGLDFFINDLDQAQQKKLFNAQLAIAANAGLPVILHVRKAHDAVLSSLRKAQVRGGICHAFNGSFQQAQHYIALGFKLGFGGMLTYERSHKLHKLAQQLPLEAIVLETDAPDMTGASHHGQRNSPEYLSECLQALATLRNEDVHFIAKQTSANAEAVFTFNKPLDANITRHTPA